MKRKIIILRGPSGSGKTTIAKLLKEHFNKDSLLISQDVVRREMLGLSDGENTLTTDLLIDLIEFGAKHQQIIILEGILRAKWYQKLFDRINDLFMQNIYAYYFDLPFEETVVRHHQRIERNEFGIEKMKGWYKEKDYLDNLNEKIITKELSIKQILTLIINDVNND
ncbi:MAG: AAA family ATPase [Thomasclavelia sp.]